MDEIVRAVTKDGLVKISAISARATVERAREIHGLSPTASAALGRTLCGASMLGELMKEEDASLTIRVNGGGPVGSVIAVSDSSGNVRGYVAEPKADLPLRKDGKLDVGGLVVESEQIPAAVGLGVLVDTDRTIKAAGGFIVQLMPGAPEELIAKLEDNILYMDQLTTVLDEDGLDAVPAQVLKGMEYDIVMRVPVEYRCSCSRERVAAALESCGAAELEDMAASGENTEVSCQFCDKVYSFTPAELREIAKGKNF